MPCYWRWAKVQTLGGSSRGCLGVNGAIVCSDEAEPIRQELIVRRNATEAALRTRLKRARQEGGFAFPFVGATVPPGKGLVLEDVRPHPGLIGGEGAGVIVQAFAQFLGQNISPHQRQAGALAREGRRAIAGIPTRAT